ncbi:exodeoxyribonuclease-5 [Loktanella atrilutea]|uniref:Exodeoxyribonuclease-5 n=1 Tax=Loktanella atrilutea TaxID=366533 RepID=A0A1M4W908_LOKAT|nr:AAA family ATPase [Loktanella atrilutea]SHE77748.1 exodeoxyribonuclease-5 [Loktanella atrilutea]
MSVDVWHKACMADIAMGRALEKPVFRVFGYAGTGKTSIARHFSTGIEGRTVYAAYTGKAAMVMKKSGCAGARTIHSLIYSVEQDEATGMLQFKWNAGSDAADAALIVIDECSMVDASLGADLLRFNRPILVLGDPAQLPPVKARNDNGTGAGFFTEVAPDVMLTEIHRQAAENPIIRIATDIREGREVRAGTFGDCRVTPRENITMGDIKRTDQVLVGRRDTRDTYNRRIREIIGRESAMPVVGDRIICIKNDKKLGIFNGGLFEIAEIEPQTSMQRSDGKHTIRFNSLDMPDRDMIEAEVLTKCWTGDIEGMPWQEKRGTAEFMYGYALTVHKAQGSQWSDVTIFDESGVFRDDWRRWLYTGVTRAAEKVTLVTNRGAA